MNNRELKNDRVQHHNKHEACELFESFSDSPFIQVPFPIQRHQLEEAMAAFLRFLELPESIKSHIDLKVSNVQRRAEVGYRHRDPEDGPYSDSKDFFHFHPMLFAPYESFLSENPVVRDFVMKAKPIWDATYSVVEHLIELMDNHFPGAFDTIFKAKNPHILLRFLKYEWCESTTYLAKPHFDAGSFTLAITESCPGLRIGFGPDDLEPVHHKEGHALFMISSNFKKIIDTDTLKPAWHDVVQLDNTKIGKPFARWAIVAFVDGANVEQFSQAETHKYA